jgi:acetyl-CoA C-acetyltransferase
MQDIAIISGARTPIGKFQDSLLNISATQLGAIVVREAVNRANIQDLNRVNG